MCCHPIATIMLLLPLLIFFPSLLTLIFAMQNSALYRHPARDLSFGNFKIAIPSVTLEKKTYIAFFQILNNASGQGLASIIFGIGRFQ